MTAKVMTPMIRRKVEPFPISSCLCGTLELLWIARGLALVTWCLQYDGLRNIRISGQGILMGINRIAQDRWR